MTNYDRIISLSKEDLAKFLLSVSDGYMETRYCSTACPRRECCDNCVSDTLYEYLWWLDRDDEINKMM